MYYYNNADGVSQISARIVGVSWFGKEPILRRSDKVTLLMVKQCLKSTSEVLSAESSSLVMKTINK